jgi:hypothetical protein
MAYFTAEDILDASAEVKQQRDPGSHTGCERLEHPLRHPVSNRVRDA